MNPRRAFTLIELLVVVGIIAILAAVAVPNLLEAQVRAKVSRVKADLRTLATAIEAYTTDHGLPPLDYSVPRGDAQMPDMEPGTSGILHPGREIPGLQDLVWPGLCKPVAYVADCWLEDPLAPKSAPFDQRKYTYNWFARGGLRGVMTNPDYLFQEYDSYYGAWRLGSLGPDGDFYNGQPEIYGFSVVYDPTNGTRSLGNIWRSQREAVVAGRPVADELVAP